VQPAEARLQLVAVGLQRAVPRLPRGHLVAPREDEEGRTPREDEEGRVNCLATWPPGRAKGG